jgi:hydrogenase maturation protease
VHSGGTIPFIKPLSSRPVPDERRRVAVLGLGNILLSDEGAGVHGAAELARRFSFDPPVDIIDGGTLGLDLLPIFQDRERVLIIDAVDFRKPPGFVEIVYGDAITRVLNPKLSVHHIGLTDLLFAMNFSRENRPQTCLVGVQPCLIEMGLSLSGPVAGAMDLILDRCIQQLTTWSTRCFMRPAWSIASIHS